MTDRRKMLTWDKKALLKVRRCVVCVYVCVVHEGLMRLSLLGLWGGHSVNWAR